MWFGLCAVAGAQEEAEREMVRAMVEDIRHTGRPGVAGSVLMSPSTVAAFYERRGFRPAWVERDKLDRLVDLIGLAGSEGLEPLDYHWPVVRTIRDGDFAASAGTHVDRATAELILTDALLVVVDHLRSGKVDTSTKRAAWSIPEHDAQQVLVLAEEAIEAANGRVSFARGTWYERMKEALENHRSIASAGGWPKIPDGPPIRPGNIDPRISLLAERLTASGDLGARAQQPTDGVYDDGLETAVRRFQERHGLDTDGTVGPATLRALNVPVGHRIDQLRLTLERARWVIDELPPDFVVANIAGFRLYVVRNRKMLWETRIVVGKPHQQTPVFADEIEYLVFNPDWVVPRSIAINEMLPAIRTDPSWFSSRNYELRDARGTLIDPATIDWQTITSDDFAWSLVQRPGADNALGRVKFVFPNDHAVYLHDTPERALFDAPNRTFSHGCIRVADPLQLAEVLLRPDGWDSTDVENAVLSGRTITVHLSRHLPILVLYWTASVDPDGTVRFYPDVYGRDAPLARALDERHVAGIDRRP
jgi:murein L,D-transpeptidase YcbB/YkuD